MNILGPWEPAPRLAAGVSGGADSTALALLASDWVRRRGGSLLALIVDHGLRPDSGAEAAVTTKRMAANAIPARVLRIQGLAHGAGLAERARDARYKVLARACMEADILHLLTGHHAADQAETLMIRALGGSASRGLAGMAALTETARLRLVRPLLTIPPGDLRQFLGTRGVDWVEDPSNASRTALRSRMRILRGDPGGTGAGTAALSAAAGSAGISRAAQDARIAGVLARRAVIRPEGFALLSALPIDPDALGALMGLVSGTPYGPPPARVAALARDLVPTTLGGVRLLPAGRFGRGLINQCDHSASNALCGEGPSSARALMMVREERRMAPPVPARIGQIWDGRFRIAAADGLPPDATIGSVGDDAARLRRFSPLPGVVLRTLPAIRTRNSLVMVPHLVYPDLITCLTVRLVFEPARVAAGAAFRPA